MNEYEDGTDQPDDGEHRPRTKQPAGPDCIHNGTKMGDLPEANDSASRQAGLPGRAHLYPWLWSTRPGLMRSRQRLTVVLAVVEPNNQMPPGRAYRQLPLTRRGGVLRSLPQTGAAPRWRPSHLTPVAADHVIPPRVGS
jgi:hypothetical protein